MRHPAQKREGGSTAFTLIEILVATTVLALLLLLTLQILSNTNTAIQTADRQMDAASQARAVLDRFETDFNNALLSQGYTALFLGADGDTAPAIGFLSRSRAREADTGSPAWRSDLRGTAIAYRMSDSLLDRGTGRMTYHEEAAGDHASGDASILFDHLASALQNGGSFLIWTSMGAGVVRFHVSFQLDNGQIVQTPPTYTMISPLTSGATPFLNGLNTSPCVAVAFSARNAPQSGALAGRYVRAVIVSVAALDGDAYSLSQTQLEQLENLGTPGMGGSAESDTAQALWEDNVSQITFPPLRQSIRFFQRIIPVP